MPDPCVRRLRALLSGAVLLGAGLTSSCCLFGELPDFRMIELGWSLVVASSPWSPDGTRLACSSLLGLQIVDLDGSPPQLLQEGLALGPAWSPDGRWIAFAPQQDGTE